MARGSVMKGLKHEYENPKTVNENPTLWTGIIVNIVITMCSYV